MPKVKAFFSLMATSIQEASIEDLVRSLATLATLGVTLFLWATSKPVPTELLGILGLLLGYFFGRVQTLASGANARAIRVTTK